MKLLNCLSCHDIIALSDKRTRLCLCGASSGKYVDPLKVEFAGPARILGINNYEYVQSMKSEGIKVKWSWFVMPEGQDVVRKR